jgi:hypothetical protein
VRYATFWYASLSANLRSHLSQDGCFSFSTRWASNDLWDENHMLHRAQWVGCMLSTLVGGGRKEKTRGEERIHGLTGASWGLSYLFIPSLDTEQPGSQIYCSVKLIHTTSDERPIQPAWAVAMRTTSE